MLEAETANPKSSALVARIAPWFPVALFLFALLYYTSYALSGLDLNGEGGTIAVVADRIREGSRPFVDTFLGYNLLWFYPIVWLFQIFGPNFTLVRIFFFGLSVCGALLGYRTILRATRRPMLSLAVGLILVLIPGIQFRNYLPFLGVANLMVILEAFGLPHRNQRSRLLWVAIAASLVSATFLFRIDLGLFFTVVLIGAALANAFLAAESRRERLQSLLATALLLPIMFFAFHLPIGYFAQTRGFADAFWAQYTAEIADMGNRVMRLLPQPAQAKATLASVLPQQSSETLLPTGNDDRTNRPLPSWIEMFTNRWGKTRILVFLIYYPIVAGLILAGGTLALTFARLKGGFSTRTKRAGSDALVLGISLASAFTLFPQYFFFRPDPQHVSEMMCVFLVTLGCACGIALDRFRSANRLLRGLLIAWIALCLLHVYLYCDYGLAVPWMGSIARKKPDEVWFKGDNEVVALLPAAEAEETRQLYEVVKSHSNRNDYVVCFPYAPTVNFMTNRRSYLYNLYVDNVNRPGNFDKKALADFSKYRPSVILVNDDPMNVVNASRFSVWAATTMTYIKQHYQYAGTFRRNDVYLAPNQ
jgi:hypothetical protein